jgi:3-dehydroquinate dehydratase-2
MRVLLLNGPNLNTLGTREPEIYGSLTLSEIVSRVEQRARALGAELLPFQSNHEGALIDFIQENAASAGGMIVNLGAFTHTSIALRDAIVGSRLPTVEVHISNVYRRERFRHRSLIAEVCRGAVVGLGWRGYLFALEALVAAAAEEKERG